MPPLRAPLPLPPGPADPRRCRSALHKHGPGPVLHTGVVVRCLRPRQVLLNGASAFRELHVFLTEGLPAAQLMYMGMWRTGTSGAEAREAALLKALRCATRTPVVVAVAAVPWEVLPCSGFRVFRCSVCVTNGDCKHRINKNYT